MGRGVATGNDDPNSDDENEHNDPDGKDFIQCSIVRLRASKGCYTFFKAIYLTEC